MGLDMRKDLTLVKRVIIQIKGFWPYFLALFLIDLLATPIGLLVPVPLKIAVDSVIGEISPPGFISAVLPDFVANSKRNLLFFVVIFQIVLILLVQLQSLFGFYLRTKLGESMILNFRARLLHQAQRLSLLFHDTKGTADSIYRIQYDAPSIQWLTIYGLLPAITSMAMLLSMLYVIVRLNLQLSLVALTILPLLFFYARFYDQRMRQRYTESKQIESNSLKVIQEVLTAIRVVKVFGREDDEEERFRQESSKNVTAKSRLAMAEGEFGLVVNMTTGIASAAVLFIGVLSVQSESLTVGELLMIITYLTQLYAPVKSISNQVKRSQSSMASLHRAFELLDETPEVIEDPDALPLDRAEGAVAFRDVTFTYNGGRPILKNVSFQVPKGSRVGIQGRTGAGKSTLLSLLCRLYDPQSGQIFLDDMDIRQLKLADLRRQFAFMLQEPILFPNSIAENIAYARPGANFSEIMEAAIAANAHEFITNLPDGYQTMIGERGMRLSGGERQRISLARAFLRDAPILILDEPTSSVDTGTEAGIMEAMEHLMQSRTTFMIAHRLSTLEKCDIRLLMEDGNLRILDPDGGGSGNAS